MLRTDLPKGGDPMQGKNRSDNDNGKGCEHMQFTWNDSASQKPPFGRAGKVVMPLVILAAGVIHGMFVSGGALLVIYASSALKYKEEFRTTMAMLWVTIGCYITATQLRSGYFDQKLLCMLGIGLIPAFAGIWIGTKLVKRIRQETFMKLTYVLLILSGILAMV